MVSDFNCQGQLLLDCKLIVTYVSLISEALAPATVPYLLYSMHAELANG